MGGHSGFVAKKRSAQKASGPPCPQIDGLRCLAILLVLFAHLNILAGGAIGVDVFFVISGYLITGILLRESELRGSFSIRYFYVRRCLRIMPAFALMLLVYAVAISFAHHSTTQYWSILYAATYTMNWARVAGLPSGLIGHTWTLSVEEQFYLVWPLMLANILSLERKWRPLVVFVLIFVSFAWRSWLIFMHGESAFDHVFFGSDTRAMEIFTGCLLAFVWNKRVSDWLLALWLVPASAILFLAFSGTPSWLVYFDSSIISLSTAWLIVVVQSGKGFLSALLGMAPLVWVGRLSYSLYLWHFLVILVLVTRLSIRPAARDVVIICLSFLLAAVSYYFIERPALRLKVRYSHGLP
jgi:peptidoglycan/LPS O-acetylase OafA/YrhL